MEEKRMVELLLYAKVCFERCTNPFAHIHLTKRKVNADECRELSHYIATILEDHAYEVADRSKTLIYTDIAKALKKAVEDFEETQK